MKMVYERTKELNRRAIVAATWTRSHELANKHKDLRLRVKLAIPERRKSSKLSMLDLYQSCSRDTRSVQEGGMLKGSRLLVSNIQTEGHI
jgi:hypothetical protein